MFLERTIEGHVPRAFAAAHLEYLRQECQDEAGSATSAAARAEFRSLAVELDRARNAVYGRPAATPDPERPR